MFSAVLFFTAPSTSKVSSFRQIHSRFFGSNPLFLVDQALTFHWCFWFNPKFGGWRWRSQFSFRCLNQSITIILIACNTMFFCCEDPNLFQKFSRSISDFRLCHPKRKFRIYLFCYDPHRIRELPATTWFLLESNSRFLFEKRPKLLVSYPTNMSIENQENLQKWRRKNVIFPSSAALMTQEGLRRVLF